MIENKIQLFDRSLQLMWEFLPRLVAPITFVMFMSSGHSITYSDMMEVIMLMNRIQGPMHHVNHMQDQIVDLRVTIMKIQEFLQQPEPEIQAKVTRHPEYAVHIENQNYTWGVQTVDIDDMFDNMMMELKGETEESRNAKRTEQ